MQRRKFTKTNIRNLNLTICVRDLYHTAEKVASRLMLGDI